MNVDETNAYLVTGDADGFIKVWDITEYCMTGSALCTDPPRKCMSHNPHFAPRQNDCACASFSRAFAQPRLDHRNPKQYFVNCFL